jgi:hypothetical protein
MSNTQSQSEPRSFVRDTNHLTISLFRYLATSANYNGTSTLQLR